VPFAGHCPELVSSANAVITAYNRWIAIDPLSYHGDTLLEDYLRDKDAQEAVAYREIAPLSKVVKTGTMDAYDRENVQFLIDALVDVKKGGDGLGEALGNAYGGSLFIQQLCKKQP
jgi:hypothetical protein